MGRFLKAQCHLLSDMFSRLRKNMTIYNVLLSLFIMFWDQNSNYFNKFIKNEDSVLITGTFVV